LPERLPVDLGAAREVLRSRVAAPLGLSLEARREGVLRIATAGMARAIRSISTERGRDLPSVLRSSPTVAPGRCMPAMWRASSTSRASSCRLSRARCAPAVSCIPI